MTQWWQNKLSEQVARALSEEAQLPALELISEQLSKQLLPWLESPAKAAKKSPAEHYQEMIDKANKTYGPAHAAK